MIPVKVEEKTDRIPVVTVLLIVVCTVVYFRRIIPAGARGLIPLDFIYTVFHPQDGISEAVLMLFTSFFLHGGLLHLLGNMWYLWIFGYALESSIGSFIYILTYVMYGVVSMVSQVVFDPISTIPIVGASGAIAGIMGMFFVMRPLAKLLIWFPPVFFFRVYAFLYLLFWFWLQWRSMVTSDASGSIVAWWAHIGGFLAGILTGVICRITGKKKKGTSERKKRNR